MTALGFEIPLSAGLCATCRHARRVGNDRGSTFVLCGRSRDERRFPRYPALPVRACPGYEPPDRADPPHPEVDPAPA